MAELNVSDRETLLLGDRCVLQLERLKRQHLGQAQMFRHQIGGDFHIPAKNPGKPRLTTSAMIASIAGEGQKTRPAPFGHALVELARSRPDVVGMTADLGKYTDLHVFAKQFPDRYYQMGMAEQLLFGAASGLAAEGFMPFATTYAVFASRRAYDFIHQTIAEERPQREDRLRIARFDLRLWPESSSRGGSRAVSRHAEHDGHRPLRCA
nr:hypothetical protein [Bradyrhizobium sp. CCBAU 11357]